MGKGTGFSDAVAAGGPSIDALPNRAVPAGVALQLAVRAGGRCQFRGCNEFLYEHRLTGETGNFAEKAHIVAFRGQRHVAIS